MDITDVNKAAEYSLHPNSEIEEVRFSPGSWTSNQSTNYAFTKSALVFKDKLDQIRGKSGHATSPRAANAPSASAKSEARPTVKVEELEMSPPQSSFSTPSLQPRVRILRVVQHALLSISSITIAVLQFVTYIKWQQTKNVPDAWPQHPTLFPTLILLAVAVMALLFDASSLVAYIWPTKPIAEKAYHFALKLHYWITSLKAFAYTIAAVVCRAGFTMGGQQDLWGWSCSSQGQQMAATNDAHVNCTGNTVAWALSLLNISVEIIGVLITQMMENSNRKAAARAMTGGSPNATNDDSASNPLLSRFADLEQLGDDVQDQLKSPPAVAK